MAPIPELMRAWRAAIGYGLLMMCLSACVPNPSRGVIDGYYQVRAGDTLYDISWRYGLNYRQVARWNGLTSPYTIYPGQRIRLRPARDGATRTETTTSGAKNTGVAKADDSLSRRSARVKSKRSDAITWHWPVEGRVIQSFSVSDGKKGIDIAARSGSSVYSASTGRVVYSGSGLIGYGRLIIIKHSAEFLSAYAHNRKLLVQEGDQVKTGQSIAKLGSSGINQPELHFEIRRNGQPVNPLDYLPHR